MAQSGSQVSPPTRAWRRTEERRTELAAAAARQFHRLGFHQVSMADVARSVGLTAPAIYRHYRSKEDLLAAAIGDALDSVNEALSEAGDADVHEFLQVAAELAVAHRELWVLLQREMRHLGPDHRKAIDVRFRWIVRRFTAVVRDVQPDVATADVQLLTTAALAALSSPSVYRRKLPADVQRAVLAATAEALCRTRVAAPAVPPPAGPSRPDETVPLPPASKSEEVLTTAIRLFAERGYAAVSLDDIGAGMGMAGPSLYYYFATKVDLLIAAFARATEWLAAQRTRANQPAALDELVAAYVELGVRERLLFSVYVWEAVNLPPEAGRRIQAGLDADVDAWCTALAHERPELSEPQRFVLVHAARAVVHDVVRLGHWHDRTDITEVLRTLVYAALAAPLER